MPLRSIIHSVWYLVALAAALCGFFLPLKPAAEFSLELSLGILGGFVAAITFALALTIQQQQAWPSARALVRDSGAFAWLVLSVASLGAAVVGRADTSSLSERFATASVWLSVLSLIVGIWNVGAILGAAGGPGRRRARVRILQDDLKRATPSARKSSTPSRLGDGTLEDFMVSFRQAVESNDLAAIRSHSDEIRAASARLGHKQETAIVRTHLRMASLLGGELLGAGPPLAARAAFADILDGVVDFAGVTLDARKQENPLDTDAERRAVLVLGEASRLAAFFAKATLQKYNQTISGHGSGLEEEYAAEILVTCDAVRQRTRFAVDPDPPERYLKAVSPWKQGVADPESVLLWLWANSDFDGSNQGSSLYPAHEILVGKKYFGTVYGDTSVLSDMRAAMYDAPARTQRVLELHGGFDRIFLEVSTNSIAQFRPHEWVVPAQLRGGDTFAIDHRASLRHFVSIAASHEQRPRDVDSAMADLVWLLGSRSQSFSAFAQREYSTAHYGSLPMRQVAARPAAAVLAVALTLCSTAERSRAIQRRQLRDYFSRVPHPLLRDTAELAVRLIPGKRLQADTDLAHVIIDRLAVVWGS